MIRLSWSRLIDVKYFSSIMNHKLLSGYSRYCWFCEGLSETGVVASKSQKSHLPRPENQTVPTNYADVHSPSLVSTLLLISGIKPRNEPKHPKTKFKHIFRCAVSPYSPREPNSTNELCIFAQTFITGIKPRNKSEQSQPIMQIYAAPIINGRKPKHKESKQNLSSSFLQCPTLKFSMSRKWPFYQCQPFSNVP